MLPVRWPENDTLEDMEKYQFSKTEFDFIANTSVPVAVYQFIDKRVVTIALSRGFMEQFGFEILKKHIFSWIMICTGMLILTI
jgi:hypothetical protein